MNEARCPHDSEPLTPNRVAASCPECQGHWLSTASLNAFAYPDGLSAEQHFDKLLAVSAKNTPLACPLGCGFLHETRHEDLVLDCCKSCHGVWFDAKELARWKALLPVPHFDGQDDETLYEFLEKVASGADKVSDGISAAEYFEGFSSF